jgi:sugar/nucleoside kinase (ribokinase family)
MSQKYDILVVGEINADLILTGDVEPAFGQVEKIIEDATLTLGSSAVIFACGAARLGLKVAFVGVVGDDLYGQYMLSRGCGLEGSKLATSLLIRIRKQV